MHIVSSLHLQPRKQVICLGVASMTAKDVLTNTNDGNLQPDNEVATSLA
jgi:hypothetical protein